MADIANMKADVESLSSYIIRRPLAHAHAHAPSPAMSSGRPAVADSESDLGSPNREDNTNTNAAENAPGLNAAAAGAANNMNSTGRMPMMAPPGAPQGAFPPGQMPPPGPYGYGYPPQPAYHQPQYPPYWDPRMQEQMQQQQAYYAQQMYYQQQMQQPPTPMGQPPMMMGQGVPPQYFPPPQQMAMPHSYQHHQQHFPATLGQFDPLSDPYDIEDEGAEPIVTITNHHLDIHIRDDQVIRSLHACMIRPGFTHALAAFTVSGIVINTLSTYMDYLVRLNGAPRSYTGIVGGTFQGIIMVSSLIMGRQTDKTRAYYSLITGMLVLGAFGLAECGVSLDSDRGGDLRWSLLIVAVLVGPLQPISTELGVEVAYPLSENTVLVIQQLFSNLLSAIFIPFFKALKDIGTTSVRSSGEIVQRPQYTFSFYLLIVLHTLVTVYFATFNGKYLRYEHELLKKQEEHDEEDEEEEQEHAFDGDGRDEHARPFYANQPYANQPYMMPPQFNNPEQQPLLMQQNPNYVI